jgi:hypothetical protein
MKTYTTPALVAKGDIVTLTQGPVGGTTDPNHITLKVAPGSVGFGL